MLFIWGTNIHLSTLQARLRRFFSNFQHPGAEQPKYMELMSQVQAATQLMAQDACQAA